MIEETGARGRSNQEEPEVLEPSGDPGAESPGTRPSFMQRLNQDERQALTARAYGEWKAAGTVICREGDPGDALYIVETGRVAVLKDVGDGSSTLLGYRGPGEIVGEMSLVSQQPRFASIIADQDTHLLCVGASDFPYLMNSHPGISWAVLNVLNDRLYEVDTARTHIIEEGQELDRRLQEMTGEAERLAALARVRQETIELIVHDLRAPLSVIDGCLELLRTSLADEELGSASQIVDLAERSSDRLIALVDELLKAARQERQGISLACQPVDLARMLRAAVDSLMVTAEQCGIQIELEMADVPHPQGDLLQLERVVTNLLDNALSYTPAGGAVTLAAVEGLGAVEISVTDTGPGVPVEHREQIFERFARVPGVEGRKRGFGLGLYFCRQVVQAHGGRIWVEPGPQGVGSRFAFTLPTGAGGEDGE